MDSDQATKPTQQTQQPPCDDCPDPNPPITTFHVDAAVAQERARLYTAEVAAIDPRYAKLDGAQNRFATATAAAKASFDDLKQLLERIASTLNCELTEDVRKHLKDCWEKLQKETASPVTTTECTDIDQLDCDHLPGDAVQLASLASLAITCAARSDAEFDALAALTDTLGPQVTALLTDAETLEKEVCASRSDMQRSYVEYLGLAQRFEDVQREWTTPTAYGCKLKASFVTLLHRHTVVICIKVAIFRLDQWAKMADDARQAKAKDLVALVLECAARPKPGETGQGQSDPGQGGSGGTAPAPPPTAPQHCA